MALSSPQTRPPSRRLRGHMVATPPCGQDGEVRLLLAIVIQAKKEAEAGNPEAADWLATIGCDWCEALLGLGEKPDFTRISYAEAKRLVPPASDTPGYWARLRAADPERYREYNRQARARRRTRPSAPLVA